ncbi:MAG: hypothetical protein AB8B65_01690 [Kordia sp.]|uniref:hypothetical protein n=1 Tax=Kordia sp. TaxID=1965332 RepID=UPI003859C150
MKLNKKSIKEMKPEVLKVIAGGIKTSDGQTQTSTEEWKRTSSAESEKESMPAGW